MKVYLDLLFLLNFSYDLLLLLTVDYTLKRHARFYKHFISAIIGALSLIILFFPFNNIVLFIFKVIISLVMIIISFGYRNIKYFFTNISYLYMTSFILGGFLYFLDNEFSYKRIGYIFYFDRFSINYLLLLLIAPVILYLYIKEHKKFISTFNYSYRISIVFKNGKILNCNGFLDTGNKLKDPITKKYVILLSKKILEPYVNIRSPMFVPFKCIKGSGIIECFSVDYIKVNDRIFNNYLVGISIDNININGSDCLLNYKLMEDLW